MRAFLNQPVEPQMGVIECMIRRKKGVMNTIYQAYYEVGDYLVCPPSSGSYRVDFGLR